MWKHIYPALVIFSVAVPCFGQFTEIWTNGTLYATEQMASQCYSASVERCNAVGITPDSPSWWDYIVGKNYAKEKSVKNNIKNCRPYFLSRSADVTNQLNAGYIGWTNNLQFLTDCGLPTNAIDETPYFNSQYASTTGGWHHIYAMLTNMSRSLSYDSGFTNSVYAWDGIGGNPTSYTEAATSAIADWGPFGGINFWYPFRAWVRAYDGLEYGAGVESDYAKFYVRTTNATYERLTKVYAIASDPSFLGQFPTEYTNFVFDAQGSSVSTNWFYTAELTTNVASYEVTGHTMFPYADSTTDPGIPPNSNITQDNTIMGYAISNTICIHDWIATTNGFKYR
jgi:hypothetical protein